MAELLQSISQFLNLNKLTAVTIPGMVAALAIILFFYPPSCSTGECWACQGEQKKAPTLTITPDRGDPGQTVGVAIYGDKSTKWDANTSVTVEGRGVTVLGRPVVDDSKITATLTIATDAPEGPRAVTVAAGSSKASAKASATFTVSANSGKITVSRATWGSELRVSAAPSPAIKTDSAGKEDSAKDKLAQVAKATADKLKDALVQLAKTTNLTACNDVPVYIVKGSRVKNQDTADKGSPPASKGKKATGFPGETPVDPANLLKTFDYCSAALQVASAKADTEIVPLQTQINGLNPQLTNLLAAQEKQVEAQNLVLAKSYDTDIRALRTRIVGLQTASQELQTAKANITNLLAQVTALRADVASQVNQAAAPEVPPAKSTFQTLIQDIVNNLLAFLAAALVLGMILDPIQRMITSWLPFRTWRFRKLNRKYARTNPWPEDARGNWPVPPGGEFRFGDRRYWKHPDALQLADPDIYQPNYAIGKGLLTQSEYQALWDNYYRQSQLATGTIFPLFLLAAAVCVRIQCCAGLRWFWIVPLSLLFLLIWLMFATILWFVGTDRLHQLYSEVQARIAGRAKKLKDTQEEKTLALLSDPESRANIIKRSKELGVAREILDCIPSAQKPPQGSGGGKP